MLDTFRNRVARFIAPETQNPNYDGYGESPTGVLYPWTSGYDDERADADKLLKASENGQVERILYQLCLLMFNKRDIKVISPDEDEYSDKLNEKTNEIQTALTRIDQQLNIDEILNRCFIDTVVFGSSFVEMGLPIDDDGKVVGWGELDDWKSPEWANYVDAYSLSIQPTSCTNPNDYVPGRVLKGVVWDIKNKNMQYWQVQQYGSQSPVRLPSGRILHIKDKRSRYPDGKSYLQGILPAIGQLELIRKSLMQHVNVHGAARCAIKVQELRDPAGIPCKDPFGKSGAPRFANAYKAAQDIVRNYGNNAVSVLWPEHDMQWSPNAQPGSVTVADEYLKKEILQHLIPRDWVEQNGNAVSKSGDELLDLAMMVVYGWRQIIAAPFEELFNRILEANGFKDWKFEYVFDDPTAIDKTVKYGNALTAYRMGAITIDRFYEETDRTAPTKDERKELTKTMLIKQNAAQLLTAFPRVGWDLKQEQDIRDAILEGMGLPKGAPIPEPQPMQPGVPGQPGIPPQPGMPQQPGMPTPEAGVPQEGMPQGALTESPEASTEQPWPDFAPEAAPEGETEEPSAEEEMATPEEMEELRKLLEEAGL